MPFFQFCVGWSLVVWHALFFSVISAPLKEAHRSNGWMPRLFGFPGNCVYPDPANCHHNSQGGGVSLVGLAATYGRTHQR